MTYTYCFSPKYRNELMRHFEANHSDPSQWICHKCHLLQASARTLNFHMHYVHNEGKFQCINCNHIANNRSLATQHYFNEHTNPTNAHNQTNSANCKTKSNLTAQLMSKLTVISLKCLQFECFAQFTNKQDLFNHAIEMHRLKPEQCPVELCSKAFSDK